MGEIISWNTPSGVARGTLKEYIAEHYPIYFNNGLYTWQDILKRLQES